jgi:acylpyruvate hydrolase
MKVVVYGPMKRLGFLVDDRVVDGQMVAAEYLSSQGEARPFEMANALVGSTLLGFIEGGDRALDTAKKALANYQKSGMRGTTMSWNARDVVLHPPLVDTNTIKVMCAGANYASHIAGTKTMEQARADALKDIAWGFYKLASNIIGDKTPMVYPSRTKRLDYEGEVAIVFGKKGKDIPKADYKNYVFGVTLFNDMSARDQGGVWDRPNSAMTFQFHKNFDGAGALGPCIVTMDEVKDPENVDFMLKVNGEVRQKSNTSQMIRTFGDWTQILSTDVTIYPGDVIAGGTCSGTVMDTYRKIGEDGKPIPVDPKYFTKVGDTMEVSSPQIGVLTNTLVAKGQTKQAVASPIRA